MFDKKDGLCGKGEEDHEGEREEENGTTEDELNPKFGQR